MKIYNANGNRFLIGEEEIDVITMCKKYDCDGYLKVYSHQMKVFNADGSIASLCINGLHCFTHYLYDMNPEYKVYALVIDNEVYKSQILDINPFISRVTINKTKMNHNFVDVGNKHLIIIGEDLKDAKNLCERYDCNVNYVHVRNRKCLEITTYERGVGFTKSCGSGNVASFLYAYSNNICDDQVVVINKGGINYLMMNDKIETTVVSNYEGDYEN